MPNLEYHDLKEYLSNSQISLYLRSPQLFGKWLAGSWTMEPNEGMRIGTAVDAILSGSQSQEFVVAPQVDRRTKQGKAVYQEFLETRGDRLVLTTDEYTRARAAVDAVWQHTYAAEALNNVTQWQQVLQCDTGSVKWKAKLDGLMGPLQILELKTHRPFESHHDHEREFSRTVAKYGYHRQAWLYRTMVALRHHVPVHDVSHTFLCVENNEPHTVRMYTLTEDFVDAGGRELAAIITEMVARRDFGTFTVNDPPATIGAPKWLESSNQNTPVWHG
jgi:exodeoxyribonuclease VIII